MWQFKAARKLLLQFSFYMFSLNLHCNGEGEEKGLLIFETHQRLKKLNM